METKEEYLIVEEFERMLHKDDCEVCGSSGHSTGECDGYDKWKEGKS